MYLIVGGRSITREEGWKGEGHNKKGCMKNVTKRCQKYSKMHENERILEYF